MSDYKRFEGETIGMRVDALINQISSLPSVYGYSAVIITSLVFAFTLLNSNKQPISSTANNPLPNDSQEAIPKTPRRRADGPQPKYHILKKLNYLAVISFISSIVKFASDASRYINDSTTMLKFMVGWSTFLCYFFGFFGISFVDAEEIQQEQIMEMDKRVKVPDERRTVYKKTYPQHKICIPGELKPKKEPLVPQVAPLKSNTTNNDISSLPDNEIASLVLNNKLKDHELEKRLDPFRAVDVRRLVFQSKLANSSALADLPSSPSLDYARVYGANCEIVVGYVPLPVGVVGPLQLNGESVYIPMATTEGCLVASTNRGSKAISLGSGAVSTILKDGITRAPCLRMSSAQQAAQLKLWCDEPSNFLQMKQAFESTTSFGKLLSASATVAGKNVYLRLCCFSGDAMGMNMVSKGSLAVVDLLHSVFPDLTLVALSGNMCTDKKAAATNWIEGRGKSVVVEATIPKDIVRTILKTDVDAIVSTNIQKNLVGSAMAGVVGGFNAHAANIVTAVFLATGQDPAQNVESSNCITLMEKTDQGDLWISCTMPSIEVGTVGGGTGLPAQSSCLKVIGCKGGGKTPGANAKQLAHVVAAATMAGELSLIAALASNTLVQAHMKHNRKAPSK